MGMGWDGTVLCGDQGHQEFPFGNSRELQNSRGKFPSEFGKFLILINFCPDIVKARYHENSI